MSPNDYLKAAKKHLNFCQAWLEMRSKGGRSMGESKILSEDHELMEIFYLTGYIAECLMIFIVYKYGGWNPLNFPPPDKDNNPLDIDIEEHFDPVFTYYTQFDFFKHSIGQRKRKVGRILLAPEHCIRDKKGSDSDTQIFEVNFSEDSSHFDLCKDKSFTRENIKAKYSTAGHLFQKVIEDVIPKLRHMGTLANMVFFDNFKDKKNNHMRLLKLWNPSIRYHTDWEKISTYKNFGELKNLLNYGNLSAIIGDLENLYAALYKERKMIFKFDYNKL